MYKSRFFNKYNTSRVAISVASLAFGGMIYVSFRPKSLLMFSWFDGIGIGKIVNLVRGYCVCVKLPSWAQYSLPAGLWLLAYMLLVDIIWGKAGFIRKLFVYSLAFVAVLSEIFQFLGILPGTFDWVDICFYGLAIIVYKLINRILL